MQPVAWPPHLAAIAGRRRGAVLAILYGAGGLLLGSIGVLRPPFLGAEWFAWITFAMLPWVVASRVTEPPGRATQGEPGADAWAARLDARLSAISAAAYVGLVLALLVSRMGVVLPSGVRDWLPALSELIALMTAIPAAAGIGRVVRDWAGRRKGGQPPSPARTWPPRALAPLRRLGWKTFYLILVASVYLFLQPHPGPSDDPAGWTTWTTLIAQPFLLASLLAFLLMHPTRFDGWGPLWFLILLELGVIQFHVFLAIRAAAPGLLRQLPEDVYGELVRMVSYLFQYSAVMSVGIGVGLGLFGWVSASPYQDPRDRPDRPPRTPAASAAPSPSPEAQPQVEAPRTRPRRPDAFDLEAWQGGIQPDQDRHWLDRQRFDS